MEPATFHTRAASSAERLKHPVHQRTMSSPLAKHSESHSSKHASFRSLRPITTPSARVLEDAGLPHALEAEPAGELEPDLSPEIIMTFEPEVQMTFDRVSLVDEDEPQPTPEHELLDESMELEQLVSVQVIDDVATHTNSMVTIRLSESDVKPSETGALPPTLKALRRSAETPKVRFNEKTSSRKAQEDVEDAEMAADLFMTRRASIDSSLACGEAESIGAELAKVEKLGRSDSVASFSSGDSQHVDWDKLDKNEEQTQRDEGADESVAFLLARLEQENNALAQNPKASLAQPDTRVRSRSRPPSMQQLKKLVSAPTKPSLRYSLLPSPPPMTELEFWSALVSNYPQTAQRLPTLTSNKIRGGVPPPLRGVVWMSIAGARDSVLEDEYERLCCLSSPYEKLIGKDIGRSFPGVDMFRDPDGDGQKMLGKVLNAFSLWDQEIGYCQGLGFVVGPLLMHMGDKDAFCVLVRLMEHYDLRSCFLPTLSGLHLRIYQFQKLLSQHLPELSAHLDHMKVEPLYLSQWFLSFFGVTCPLPMLLRIYDVIMTEGASETLMRVALSLMRRNEKRILAATEFEDIMQLLLSRMLWDTYGCNADGLVADFCGLTGLVTREGLQALEMSFKETQPEGLLSPTFSRPSVHSAAARFLGKFWAGAPASPKGPASPSLSPPARPASYLRRTPSKQSMASTLNSVESSESNASQSTDATSMSRQSSTDYFPVKPILTVQTVRAAPNKDKDLHGQIEDLLTALSESQRDQNALESALQREREEREEDRAVVQRAIEKLKKRSTLAAIPEDGLEHGPTDDDDTADIVAELEERFAAVSKRSSIIIQSKHQLRDELARWKDQHAEETARSSELAHQLAERDREASLAKDELREARSRLQEAHQAKQRLDKANQDLRARLSLGLEMANDGNGAATAFSSITGQDNMVASPHGLREFKLGRPRDSVASQAAATATFAKRMSSLSTKTLLSTEDHRPAGDDALLLELVHAKTAEAVARQELEEVKCKLDSLRKLVSGAPCSSSSSSSAAVAAGSGAAAGRASGSVHLVATTFGGLAPQGAAKAQEPVKAAMPVTPGSTAGGFFSGWGRRTASTAGITGG